MPQADPRILALTQASENPPADDVKSVAFARHRDRGMPRGFSGVARQSGSAGGRGTRNTVITGGGQTGTYIGNDGEVAAAFTGMQGNSTAWTGEQFGYTQSQTDPLYGPTAHPVYSCLEIGTAYWASVVTLAEVYAFDFCDPGAPLSSDGTRIGRFVPLFNIDAAFQKTYTAYFGASYPEYSFQILRNPDGRATAYFYNWDVKLWLPRYTSVTANYNPGFVQPQAGWDIFEPKYRSGLCVGAPPIEAGNVLGYNMITNTWIDLGSVPSANSGPSQVSDCIGYDDQSQQGYYYQYYPGATLGNWRVYSEQNSVQPLDSGCDTVESCCYGPISECCGTIYPCGPCDFVTQCCDPTWDTACCGGSRFTGGGGYCTQSRRRSVSAVRQQTERRAVVHRTTRVARSKIMRRRGHG